jgi:hypothetical protein
VETVSGTLRYDLIKAPLFAEEFPFLVLAPALSGSNRSQEQRFPTLGGRKLPVLPILGNRAVLKNKNHLLEKDICGSNPLIFTLEGVRSFPIRRAY